MSETSTASTRVLSQLQARRGIYIDFEGRKDEAPVLLGRFWSSRQARDPQFVQYVLDERFRSAAEPPATEFRPFERAIELLIARVEQQNRVLIGWSWHELEVIRLRAPHLAERFEGVYRDAKQVAERWRSILRPDLEIEREPHQPKHRLDVYADLFGFARPQELGVKDVGGALGRLGTALEKASFAQLPASTKQAWERILRHNEFDCRATKHVCVAALDALQQRASA